MNFKPLYNELLRDSAATKIDQQKKKKTTLIRTKVKLIKETIIHFVVTPNRLKNLFN